MISLLPMGLLLDHLWQSTLFVLAASLVALALSRNGAAVRYWLWFAAAAKFLVPFAVIAWAAAELAAQLHAQAPAPPRLELARQVLAPMTAPMTASGPAVAIRPLARAPAGAWPWLAAAWILGTAAVLAWRAAQWRALTRALAEASPLPVPAALPVVAAGAKGGPAVVGFLRPVLVLPHGLVEQLTPAELEAVLEHELCHARRRDNLLALPLLAAQALFWFHPLVWWIGRRLMAERERACDEAVLQGGTDAETYARGLLETCRLELAPPSLLAAAATGGADLKRRIRRIMADRAPRPLGAQGGLVLASACAVAVAAPVLAGVYTAAPAAAAQALVRIARPLAAAAAPTPASDAIQPKATPAAAQPVKLTLVPAPAVLADTVAYAPPAQKPIRLALVRTAVPAFQPAPEPDGAPPQTVDHAPPNNRAELLQSLAGRTDYVVRADVWRTRLDLRSGRACPTGEVARAERELAGETISTAFDGRVRRFVDETLAGKPQGLTPAMTQAVDKALPVLRPALAGRFGATGEAQLIGEDDRGVDVYLVRAGPGYVLVGVDDLGQIEAALFCAAG